MFAQQSNVRDHPSRDEREHEQINHCLSMIVSPVCLLPCRIMTHVLLVLKAGGNFFASPPDCRLITEPVAEEKIYFV